MSAPVLITRSTLAASAAEAWLAGYGTTGNGFGSDKVETHQLLVALGPSPSPDHVDEVIGNKSWTRVPECDGCGEEKDAVVRVGESWAYESSTAVLCAGCLGAAVAALDGAK